MPVKSRENAKNLKYFNNSNNVPLLELEMIIRLLTFKYSSTC